MVTTAKPRLAFVTPWLPDPEGTGSEQRAYSFLKAYARHFDIDLWFSSQPFNWDFSRLARIVGLCATTRYFHVELLRADIDGLQQSFNASLKAADHVHLFKLPFGVTHKSVIWDYDELPKALREKDQDRLTEQDKAFQRFSQTCRLRFCSSALEVSPEVGNAHVVPNCYHQLEARKRMTQEGHNLLFTGTLSYDPNPLGLLHFVRHVWPLMPQEVTLTIVGRRPLLKPNIAAMAEVKAAPRVTVHYDVPTCSPFYDDAAAAIVPLQHGMGTRLKILEAFAHRCPVVSTAKGCEGLDVQDGKELLVRDDPQAFADACMQALGNAALRKSLTRNAQAFLKSRNSQAAVETRLDAVLEAEGLLPHR